MQPATQQLDETTIQLLRCPLTRSALHRDGDFLIAECGLKYPIRAGVPVLLIEEALLPPGIASLDELKRKLNLS